MEGWKITFLFGMPLFKVLDTIVSFWGPLPIFKGDF